MTAPTSPTKTERSPEWFLAVTLSFLAVVLHLYFFCRAGGLWRDEVNSVSIAQGGWSKIEQDSFPFLFPTLLRGWLELGWGANDFGLRIFGTLLGLSLIAAFWQTTSQLRRLPPLWSLVLVALNSWIIIYDTSLRAYGLGSTLIVLCVGAAWQFLEKPKRKSGLLFTVTAILSVQTLYQNAALVAAICAGGMAVSWRQKNYKLAAGVFFSGLMAMISLLPYLPSIWHITHNTSLVRTDFNFRNAFTCLNTLLEFPLPQFLWIWLGLIFFALTRFGFSLFKQTENNRAYFSGVIIMLGFIGFLSFLRFANFNVQPWYFLPLLAFVIVTLEMSLPRLNGKFRSALWGGVLATALISIIFSVRLLDYQFTNLNTLAKRINAEANAKDFVIVKNWPFGITFNHYFQNRCAWTTIPPLADHTTHRYDLLALQMQNPETLNPVLEQTSNTLCASHDVWIIGNFSQMNLVLKTNSPLISLSKTTSSQAWNETLDTFLQQHCQEIIRLEAGTNEAVNYNERAALFKATGWKN